MKERTKVLFSLLFFVICFIGGLSVIYYLRYTKTGTVICIVASIFIIISGIYLSVIQLEKKEKKQ